ncbi:MAG: hypothetical protein KGL53_09270, partial [Elusimicrobia bacterium]|nr:hypothetical protein [Elusimicrobiota bacterium]
PELSPEEVPPALPPEEPPPPPPAAPTELAIFLQTRVDLLQKNLETAQQEALRANLLMREREEAQRKAQTEVEDLFRNIREQQRAAGYDRMMRENYSSAAARVRELEARLALAQLRMVPAEDVLRQMESEAGRAELARRLQEQLGRAEAGAPEAPAGPSEPPQPPGPEALAAAQAAPAALPAPGPATGFRLEQLSVVLERLADLERRLEEAKRERDREREARVRWEQTILSGLGVARSRFERAGGPDVLVEAALEGVVESVRQRDALQLEMSRDVEALRDEPPGSEKAAELRGRLAQAHKRMAGLQAELDKQLALVEAWVKRQTGGA